MTHTDESRQRRDDPRRGSLTDGIAVGMCLLCLIAIIPAAIMYARESAREQRRSQSLHQLGTAVQSYHQTWNAFPSGAGRKR